MGIYIESILNLIRLIKYDIVITTYDTLSSELKDKSKLIGAESSEDNSEDDSTDDAFNFRNKSKKKTKISKVK